MIKEIKVTTAANKLKRRIPYPFDLNIYRGCVHACQYCFAMYSHKYLDNENFFTDIFVKTNIAEKLDEQLSSKTWKKEIINIGGVTDSYQPIEKKYELMREVLKVMIKHKNPIIISTKSKLILRDFDLIDELSQVAAVNIAATIITMDAEIQKKIEQNSASFEERFEVLKKFRKTNASIGVHLMPIIPFITDSEENFDKLFRAARDVNVDYVLPGTLYLRGKTRKHFFSFLEKNLPEIFPKFSKLYKTGGAGKEYKNNLYKMLNRLRDKYGLSSSYMKPIKEKLKTFQNQGSLF